MPAGLALAVGGGALYVANLATAANGGQIIRVTLPSTTDRLPNRESPFEIAADADSIYWTERGSGGVIRATLALGNPTSIAVGQTQPYGIALDDQYVYWTNEGTNDVLRVPKAGGARTQIAGAQATPHGIVVDSSLVYWANQSDGTIKATPPGGGAINLVAGSLTMPEMLAIYQNDVYATTATTVAKVTGQARRIIATDQKSPVGLAFDNGFVYWTNRGTAPGYTDGSVMRMSLSSGSPEVLARSNRWATSPWSIVVDSQYVYWTTFTANGSVWRLPK
jgi:streptogramin lyase